MWLAALVASSCPESAATVTRSRGDPSGEDKRLMGKGWIARHRLLGKAVLTLTPRLRFATVTLRGKKHILTLITWCLWWSRREWGSQLESNFCLSQIFTSRAVSLFAQPHNVFIPHKYFFWNIAFCDDFLIFLLTMVHKYVFFSSLLLTFEKYACYFWVLKCLKYTNPVKSNSLIYLSITLIVAWRVAIWKMLFNIKGDLILEGGLRHKTTRMGSSRPPWPWAQE